MKSIQAIQAISKEIEMLEALRDFGDIDSNQLEYLSVLNCCYELLARTAIVESDRVLASPEMIEQGDAVEWPHYMHGTEETIDEFLFRIAVGKGDISLKQLFEAIYARKKFGNPQITIKKIAGAISIRAATISDFRNAKKKMSVDNLEKALNYIQNYDPSFQIKNL